MNNDRLGPAGRTDASEAASTRTQLGRVASFGQWRLWFLDQMEPGNPAYNVQVAVRLQGALDISALEAALTEVSRRHEILRTSFATVGGEPRQFVSPPAPFRLSRASVPASLGSEADAQARRLAADEARRPFDLARGPLTRGLLIRLAERDHALILVMHHIVTDGWSTGVLFRELGTLYGAFLHGLPSPLPDVSMQYADFAEWQRESVRGQPLQRELAYWTRQLGGELPAMSLPTDRPRAAAQAAGGRSHSFAVPQETAQALKSLGLDCGATVYMTLLAAFAVLLHQQGGQKDLVVGTPMAGRTQIETEDLIGFFINPLALRIDLSGDPTFRQLLRRVREVAVDAYAHQNVPFEKIVEALHAPRSLGRSPLFQAWFVLQNVADPRLELEGVTVTPLEPDAAQLDRGPDGTARHDLRLGLRSVPNGLMGTMEYRTDLFEPSTIATMVAGYEAILRAVVREPDAGLSAVLSRALEAQSREEEQRERSRSEAARVALKSSRRKPVPAGAPQDRVAP